jgi:hypothetical protein
MPPTSARFAAWSPIDPSVEASQVARGPREDGGGRHGALPGRRGRRDGRRARMTVGVASHDRRLAGDPGRRRPNQSSIDLSASDPARRYCSRSRPSTQAAPEKANPRAMARRGLIKFTNPDSGPARHCRRHLCVNSPHQIRDEQSAVLPGWDRPDDEGPGGSGGAATRMCPASRQRGPGSLDEGIRPERADGRRWHPQQPSRDRGGLRPPARALGKARAESEPDPRSSARTSCSSVSRSVHVAGDRSTAMRGRPDASPPRAQMTGPP